MTNQNFVTAFDMRKLNFDAIANVTKLIKYV